MNYLLIACVDKTSNSLINVHSVPTKAFFSRSVAPGYIGNKPGQIPFSDFEASVIGTVDLGTLEISRLPKEVFDITKEYKFAEVSMQKETVDESSVDIK